MAKGLEKQMTKDKEGEKKKEESKQSEDNLKPSPSTDNAADQ